ncbi:hypothetical protein D3C72_1324200 [compost metagenome]
MLHLQPGQHLELLGGDLADGAVAARCVGELAIGAAQGCEHALHVLVWRVGARHQHIGHGDQHADRREVLLRVVVQLAQVRPDRERARRGDVKRVAVRRGLRDHIRGDQSARAGTVVDDDIGLQLLRQRGRNGARECIGAAARREAHDDADGLGGFGPGRMRGERRGGGKEGKEDAHRASKHDQTPMEQSNFTSPHGGRGRIRGRTPCPIPRPRTPGVRRCARRDRCAGRSARHRVTGA